MTLSARKAEEKRININTYLNLNYGILPTMEEFLRLPREAAFPCAFALRNAHVVFLRLHALRFRLREHPELLAALWNDRNEITVEKVQNKTEGTVALSAGRVEHIPFSGGMLVLKEKSEKLCTRPSSPSILMLRRKMNLFPLGIEFFLSTKIGDLMSVVVLAAHPD